MEESYEESFEEELEHDSSEEVPVEWEEEEKQIDT